MKKLILAAAAFMLAACENADVVTPTANQKEWADCEIGVLIHFEMFTYRPDYNWRQWGTHPDASVFNPTKLNTDQWMEAAKNLGAGYAVLVAKHCSGFSLWPTNAHEYSVKNSPWKDGKGDLVKEFTESCRKYGIRPGLYASASANGYFHVDNPGLVQKDAPVTQEEYNHIVETQMTELWSGYGELFEIWFDGGVLPKEKGGPDLWPILEKYQPNTIKFQGLKEYSDNIRWVGNEEGFAPDPCWATTDSVANGYAGIPDGKMWNPGEADFTLRWNSTRHGGWFWAANEDEKIFTVEQLMEKYEKSVGRNCNMLLGIVVDTSGLVPEGDMKRIKEFGEAIKAKYGSPVCSADGRGNVFSLELDGKTSVDRIMIQEDISLGERVLEYRITADGKEIATGTNVGHKRIVAFDRCSPENLTLEITKSKARPSITKFAAYE